MTRDEFMQLKAGDVVRLRNSTRGINRRVISGPGDDGGKYIQLEKIRQSWTRSRYTLYNVGTCFIWEKVEEVRDWQI